MDQLNYLHGTGHGIGSYLNVHEGPQRIGSDSMEPVRQGQVVSIEPGYYEADNFGIRIESVYVVRAVGCSMHDELAEGPWLCFDRITEVPFDLTMIEWNMLSHEERLWVLRHNKDVSRRVCPSISKADKETLRWLHKQVNWKLLAKEEKWWKHAHKQ